MEIKNGSSRIVFLVGNYAIKIPSFRSWNNFLHGLLGNMCEARFSKMGEPKMCPVLFNIPGGFLNIMPRVTPVSEDSFHRIDVKRWRECERYVVPVEDKIDSFGFYNGKLVAIDYGGEY